MNFPSLKKRLGVIGAMTKKELKISFRFPKNFIALQLVNPLKFLVMFALVYQSFFVITNNQTLGEWNRGNYISILILGTIFYTCATSAFYRFRFGFLSEKYWKTIQVLLTSPVSKLDFLIAASLSLLIELGIPILCYLVLFQIYHPLPLPSLLFVMLNLYLTIFGMLGISLMQGSFSISNENYLFIFDYFYMGLVFFSCFYYDDGAIPEILRFLVKINPLYHAMEMARTIVLHHLSLAQILSSLTYLLCFAAVTPSLGALFFRKVVRELGVRGF